jgi:hypothetical protein
MGITTFFPYLWHLGYSKKIDPRHPAGVLFSDTSEFFTTLYKEETDLRL